MANVEYRAYVIWDRDLIGGSATLTGEDSGVFGDVPVTFASRTQSLESKASPGELIASEHATCYARALSTILTKQHTPPQRLTVEAVWTIDDEALEVRSVNLNVWGEVSDIDEEDFEYAAGLAEKLCPVSNPLMSNVEIRLQTRLSG